MGRAPYSKDIRGLVVAEVRAGSSRRAAARRFRVSASSAIRWVEEHGKTGRLVPRQRRPVGRSAFTPEECSNYFRHAGYAPS